MKEIKQPVPFTFRDYDSIFMQWLRNIATLALMKGRFQ